MGLSEQLARPILVPVEPDELNASLHAAQLGDERAMADLYRALNPALLRYLRHRVPGAAEDLVAECWLAASTALVSFEGDAADLRAWLFAVARRRVADHWRAWSRRPRSAPLEELAEERAATPAASDPGELVVGAMSAQSAVRTLVAGLSEEQTEVVLLRVVAGLSVDQVAALLGKRPGAIRVIQHRALRAMAARHGRSVVTR